MTAVFFFVFTGLVSGGVWCAFSERGLGLFSERMILFYFGDLSWGAFCMVLRRGVEVDLCGLNIHDGRAGGSVALSVGTSWVLWGRVDRRLKHPVGRPGGGEARRDIGLHDGQRCIALRQRRHRGDQPVGRLGLRHSASITL